VKLRTNAPRYGRFTTSPSWISRAIAARVGVRLIPSRAAVACSSNCAPAGNAPEAISRTSAS
jgi:hypothetical protein